MKEEKTITIDLDEYDELMHNSYNYDFIIKYLMNSLEYNEIEEKLLFKFRKEEEFVSVMKLLDYRIVYLENKGYMNLKGEDNENRD